METVLHSFKGQNGSDGANPQSGLIFDRKGALYGTTYFGGSSGSSGTVFKVSPPAIPSGSWKEEVLFDFSGSGLLYPEGSLIFDAEGKLYGVTNYGGSTRSANGAVYSLTPPASGAAPWTLGVLYSFVGDGGYGPGAGLISSASGTLYGTTTYGGATGNGAVFQLQCSQWSGTGAAKTCVGW